MRLRVLLTGLVSAAALAAQTGVIAGRVVEWGSEEPIEDARVVLQEDKPGADALVAMARTDRTGWFRFERVPPGRWNVTASQPGYVEARYGPDNTPSALADGERRESIVFQLARLGSIQGRVTDELGNSVNHASVHLYRRGERHGRLIWESVDLRVAGTDGKFAFDELLPGRYQLRTSADAAPRPRSAEVSVRDTQSAFGGAIFPDSPDGAGAIDLSHPGERKNVEIALPHARVLTLHVRPTLPDGAEVKANLSFQTKHGGQPWSTTPDLRTTIIAGVLCASAVQDQKHYYARRELDLRGAGSETRIAIQLEPGVPVAGRVRVEGPLTAPLVVTLLPQEVCAFNAPVAQVAEADATGARPFLLRSVPPGKWWVEIVGLPANWTIRSVLLGKKDVSQSGITGDEPLDEELELVAGPAEAKP